MADVQIVQNDDDTYSAYCAQCDGFVRTTRAPHVHTWDHRQLAQRQGMRHNELHEHFNEVLRELMTDAVPAA